MLPQQCSWLGAGLVLGLLMVSSGRADERTPIQLAQAETGAPAGKKREEKVKAEAHLSVDKLPPGGECHILIRLTVQPGWHINANPADPMEFVATEVTFKGKQGTKLTGVRYPKGKAIRMQDLEEPVSVYDGKVDIFGKLTVPSAAAAMAEEMEIVIKYQACDDQQCLLPTTIKLSGKLPVAKAGENVRPINERLFQPAASPQ